jgi:hypothetical protein
LSVKILHDKASLPKELRSAVSVERVGRTCFPPARLCLEAFVARQEARKATCVASPPSQSVIGVVKRNHALNSPSRIENANLAGTKSSAGFSVSNLPLSGSEVLA